MQRTFIILKPDAIQRGLVGEVIQRIEHKGFKITGMKMVSATDDQVFSHYNKDDVWFEKKGQGTIESMIKIGRQPEKEAIEYGKDIIRTVATYIKSNPVIVMVVEGHNVVNVIRKLAGGTEPMTADVGTIRGDFSNESYEQADLNGHAVRNVIHCSEDVADAEREVAIWFGESEIQKYTLATEKLAYDVNLDGKSD